MLGERAKTLGISMVIHGALLAGAATLAVRGLEQVAGDEIEIAIVELAEPEPEPAPEPEVEPEPVPEPVPVVPRPKVVPKKVAVAVTDKPKPFQRDAVPGDREAPADAEAVATPRAPMTFEMESEVGGGGGDYVSTSRGGDMKVAAPGPSGGRVGDAVENQGAIGVETAKDWQVTSLPAPINDKSYEPDYPPLAKREKREAQIRLELDVGRNGRVAGVRVLAGPKGHGFRRSAIAYAKKLRFRPAKSGKNIVAARIEWTVYFYARN